MILRLLAASIGAVTITVCILFGMSEFTSAFRERSGERYYLITDILPAPERRRMPRPPDAALPPERQPAGLAIERTELTVEPLRNERESLPVAPGPELPSLDPADPAGRQDD
jgi:hypothetical protein